MFNASTASVSSTENQQLLTKMTEYQAFQFDSDSLYNLVNGQVGVIGFQLNVGAPYNWSFSMNAYDIFSPGATISYTNQSGTFMEAAGPSNTYRGTLTEDSTAIVRLLISGNTFTGFIKTPTETYRINPIGFWVANPVNPNVFVIIKESQLTEPPTTPTVEPWCPTGGEETGGNEIVERGGGTLCIELAVDCNREMYINHGVQTVAVVANYVMGVDLRYTAELNIRVLLSYIHVWQTPSPFEGTFSSANALWTVFQDYWNANNACINRDVAILLKGQSSGTGAAGYVESPGAVCVGRATSYVFVVESTTTGRTIGHELGHWLSASHTQASQCANTCYVMCQAPNCAVGGPNDPNWTFSQQSKNKINSYLTSNDPLFVYYKHDWCLGNSPGITGPSRLCVNQEGIYSYNSFLAGTQFPGSPSHTLVWTTGPGLTIVSTDPTAQTATVKGTGNGLGSWVGVQLAVTPSGANAGFGCSNGSPIAKKEVHAGLPLSAGTPNITSYWINGNLYYNVGFWPTASADEYQYSYQVYNVPLPSSQSGVTTDINPLITGVPQGGCITATVLAGNECGFLTQSNNFPVTICFNSPIKKPDGTEVVMAEMAGEAIELPLNKLNDGELASTSQIPAVGAKLPIAPPIPLQEAVFPNPASNKVTLHLPYEQSKVIVQDAAGRVVATFELGTGVHDISSRDWPDGIYFLTVRTKANSNSTGSLSSTNFLQLACCSETRFRNNMPFLLIQPIQSHVPNIYLKSRLLAPLGLRNA